MRFYPANLNIEKKLCIVIGGGKVAERKVKNILFCGGKVKVVSPKESSNLAKMFKQRKIDYIKCRYRPDILKGAYLVYAATSSRKTNSKIAKDARRRGVLVNVCDSASESTFILPAVLRKGGITIAVSTDGAVPKGAVSVRNKLKEMI